MYLIRTLRGSEKLAVVFWLYCFLIPVAFFGAASFLEEQIDTSPRWFLYVLAALWAVYLLWAHISLWFCAFNVRNHFWGYAARAYIVVLVGAWLLNSLTARRHDVQVYKVSYAQPCAPADGPAFGVPSARLGVSSFASLRFAQRG